MEFWQLHRDYIQALGTTAVGITCIPASEPHLPLNTPTHPSPFQSRSLHAYSKMCGLLAQLIVHKLNFHHDNPSFAGDLQDDVVYTGYGSADLLKLLDTLMELQQVNLMFELMIFSTLKSVGVSDVDSLVWPLVTIVLESVFIYNKVG